MKFIRYLLYGSIGFWLAVQGWDWSTYQFWVTMAFVLAIDVNTQYEVRND